jgi:hypothetical protein
MGDPRLNSLHLDPPRRQDYRRARELLLEARGNHTLCAEQNVEELISSHTVIQNAGGVRSPESLDCWLMDKEFIYPLKVGVNTVGRSPDNDVVVQDGYVSRRHCAILVHLNHACELHDTASKNGTFINGVKLAQPTRLNSGDEIRMCDRHFVFVTRDGGRKPPAPGAPGAVQTATLAE